MKICDSHLHSNNSFDAVSTVDELCLAAIQKGLSAVTITDHCDSDQIHLGAKSEYGDIKAQLAKSLADVKAAQKKFSGRLTVLAGVEIGQPLFALSELESAVNYDDFDFCLGSVHNLKGEQDFHFLEYSEENVPILLKRYFEAVAELSAWERYDSLAHLTYPLRYIAERTEIKVNMDDYREYTDKIFKNIISRGKALEVNTSGLRKPIGVTLPTLRLAERYKRLGGEFITLGSDAHNAADLGLGIKETLAELKKIGFDYYVIFKNHKPEKIYI